MQNEDQIMVLNDLVKINNDRIEGYRKASENLKKHNMELLSLFNDCISDSQSNREELIAQVRRLGGEYDEGTTISGKIYRMWMDVKATFGGDDAAGILASCEGGEDAAKSAYKAALESNYIDTQSHAIIINQQRKQLAAHERIKLLREKYSD